MARQRKLFDYYCGHHEIERRQMADSSKPNNKIVNPYAHYITDMMTGYFMGEPVQYNSQEEELLDIVNAIFAYNDESKENSVLAQNSSIFGVSYELLYLDEEGSIRFKTIDPIGSFPIYDNTIEEELLYFIRAYENRDIETQNITTYVEVYTRNSILYYEKTIGALTLINEVPHNFGLVPVAIYYNNAQELGDFETVLSEIDAYDKMESDSLNETEYFNDCYLALYGLEGTDSEDIRSMKENRVLLMPSDAKAEWLTKSINDTYLENEKTRLDRNIHKFSYCPPMTDEDFSSNASGVAMKYKLMGLENATAKKESSFKVGLQRRLELICNILAVFGTSYDYREVQIMFTRNIPVNIVEMADVISKVGHLYSEKTQMAMLPIEVDYAQEKAQKEKEQGSN